MYSWLTHLLSAVTRTLNMMQASSCRRVPPAGLKMAIPSTQEEGCMDLVNHNDCADGKLHCRPTATKELRTPINGSAIIKDVISKLIKRDPEQTEFHQAAHEVLVSLVPVIEANPEFADNNLLERMVEPERTISFRVPWTDDLGATHVNRFNMTLRPGCFELHCLVVSLLNSLSSSCYFDT